MRLPAFLLAFLLLGACDSAEGPSEQPPPGSQDDGSVDLADVYTADVSGTAASFFRASDDGTCTTALVTLRFDVGEFDLLCTIEADGQEDVVYNPDGTFEYVLDDGELTLSPSFDYTLTGTARDNGDRIDAAIQRGNGRSIEAVLIAQR